MRVGFVVLALGLLVGCASQPKTTTDAEKAALGKTMGRGLAGTEICLYVEALSPELGEAFISAVWQYLEVHPYDKEVMAQTYEDSLVKWGNEPLKELQDACHRETADIAQITQNLNRASEAQQSSVLGTVAESMGYLLMGMMQGAADMETSGYNSSSYTPMEQPEPDFGVEERDSDNVLINTDDGTVLCNRTGDYVNCY